MAFQKGVSIMKHVTQKEYIMIISPLEIDGMFPSVSR